MKRQALFIPLIAFILLFAGPVSAQQPTFGPICDTTTPGVTCAPTNTPAPTTPVTDTPVPTATDTPTPTLSPTPIKELPKSGAIETTTSLLKFGTLFMLAGSTGYLAIRSKRE